MHTVNYKIIAVTAIMKTNILNTATGQSSKSAPPEQQQQQHWREFCPMFTPSAKADAQTETEKTITMRMMMMALPLAKKKKKKKKTERDGPQSSSAGFVY